jgi:hypothetical protein
MKEPAITAARYVSRPCHVVHGIHEALHAAHGEGAGPWPFERNYAVRHSATCWKRSMRRRDRWPDRLAGPFAPTTGPARSRSPDDRRADVIVVPADFTRATGQRGVPTEIRARGAWMPSGCSGPGRATVHAFVGQVCLRKGIDTSWKRGSSGFRG